MANTKDPKELKPGDRLVVTRLIGGPLQALEIASWAYAAGPVFVAFVDGSEVAMDPEVMVEVNPDCTRCKQPMPLEEGRAGFDLCESCETQIADEPI